MSKQHCAMNLDTTKQTLIHNINRPKSSKLFPMLNDAKENQVLIAVFMSWMRTFATVVETQENLIDHRCLHEDPPLRKRSSD